MNSPAHPIPFRRHALVLALALAVTASHAQTIAVKEGCTLRNAIINANTDTDTDGASGCLAGSGADTLNLKAKSTYTFSQTDNNTDGNNALPSITSVITINGNNAVLQRSTAPDTPAMRLLHVGSTGNLTLNRLQVTGGKAPAYYNYHRGGGIYNRGTVSLNNSTITDNRAGNDGGGIHNLGNLTVNNSLVSGNRAGANGGGIASLGKLTLTDSHISANHAVDGSALWNKDSTMTLTNSTVSGNTASNGAAVSNAGGGYFYGCYGRASLLNSTVSGNKGMGIQNQQINSTKHYNYYDGGGGYYLEERCQLTLVNSTLTNNSGSGADNHGVLILGNSLLAANTGDCANHAEVFASNGTNFIGDKTCNAQLSGNPKLGPLLDNGGSTPTQALLAGSPANNKATEIFCPKTDQRHINRQLAVNQACDIGAYQRLTFLPASTSGLLQFFDNQASINALIGITPAKQDAVRRQVLVAGEYQDRHQNAAACIQLNKTLTYIDTDGTPDQNDYITGSAAATFAQNITALRTAWQCR
jgi:hypothetical protein